VTDQHVAFVTGGSRGIGRATVVALASAGHPVAFCYSSDEAGARATQEAAEQAGGKVLAVCADVADVASVDGAFGEIESSFGPVTVLVNNAGIARDGLVARMNDEQWQTVIDTNLGGAFRTIRRATKAMMKARYGRIVNVSSASGQMGQAGQANYSAAKAGLLGFSKAVALESAARGITVNVIAPGYIGTEMVQAVPKEVLESKILPQIPLGRLGNVEEIARCVSFLAADDAGFITGACLDANGGQYMA